MVVGIIPARLDSTRFPEKILASLGGKPMVIHVAERAAKAKNLDKVILAIDSKKTEEALLEYNFELRMTSKNHLSGTDRVAEVAKRESDAELIINIQGDEPLLDPKLIDDLVNIFQDTTVEMATVVSRKLTVNDLLNPNVVKAILDENQNTKDFKRNVFDIEIGAVYRHIGMYDFKRDTLFEFASKKPSEREKEKSLEQFRALDYCIPIKALITNCEHMSVDTPDDLQRVAVVLGLDLDETQKVQD